MKINLVKTNGESKTSEYQEMEEIEVERMKKKERCKFERRKKRMLMTEAEREATNKRLREYAKEYRRKKQMLETEMQRTIRVERQKEANRKYSGGSKARQWTPEEYLAWLQSERVRSKRRIREETPEQREIRLEQKRKYYHNRWQNMTQEEKEAKRQRDRKGTLSKRRKLAPKFVGDHLDSAVNSTSVPGGSMENTNTNSRVTNRPRRSTKTTAKFKSRCQLNSNDLSLKEREYYSSEQPSIRDKETTMDKLKLRAVVILERIRVDELTLNISGKGQISAK